MSATGPGISGNYDGSCIVCFEGTDTGLALVGEFEHLVAGLERLGVPQDEAVVTLCLEYDCPPGTAPAGPLELPVRVCQACAERAGFKVRLALPGLTIPTYRLRSPEASA